jgi:hypothetical protein
MNMHMRTRMHMLYARQSAFLRIEGYFIFFFFKKKKNDVKNK